MPVISIEISDEAAARLSAAAAHARVTEGEVVEAALGLTEPEAAAFEAFIVRGEADVVAGRVRDLDAVMEQAAQDLLEALALLAEHQPDAAAALAARIEAGLRLLGEYPELGRNSGTAGLRRWQVRRTPYRLVYRDNGTTLVVVRMWHGARQWPPAD